MLRDGAVANARSVLFVCTALQRAGAETQVAALALALKARGWEVAVASMTPPTAFAEELREAGVAVESLGMRRGFANPVALLGLRRIIKRRRPSVLHSHLVHANVLARLTRAICEVPVLVSTAHSISDGGRLRRWGYRLTDRLTDVTTNVSRAAVERYVEAGAAPPGRIRFMPNGLETERFAADPAARAKLRGELDVRERFVWLAVGRFEEAKDYRNMLEAFARVARDRADAVLLVAGGGSLEQQVRALVKKLGLAACVRFLGVRRDVPQLMSAADAYVLSSAWEGMPMVLLEASAAGLPVVATQVGGNGEVVLDGRSGLLVPPKDPAALAAAVVKTMELSECERREMGRRGREFVRAHFDMGIVVEQWERLYAELLAAKGVPLCA
jgi:glycosyltransferase involved in cell wall biosynthesis